MDFPLDLRPNDRYDVHELIGEGGMGRVHRAWDRDLSRFVALKFIRGGDPSLAQRLIVEARLQSRVDHPHVARVYEVGTLKGEPFIAMQLIKGHSLEEVCTALSFETKVGLFIQVASAVQAAHKEGLIHRDLKPGNVLVEPGAGNTLHPYLTDFGLARGAEGPNLTTQGFAAGTLPYMSPEQVTGEGPVDFRSDVYGLGATLYALMTGHPPFECKTDPGRSPDQPSAVDWGLPISMMKSWFSEIRGEVKTGYEPSLLRRVIEEDPPPPSVLKPGLPKDLDTVVMKCLEKLPHQRYGSAQALAEDLQCLLEGKPILARASSRLERANKWMKRHRALTRTIASGSALFLIAVAGWARANVHGHLQAAAALRMGSEAQAMEAELRAAYLAPAHDVRPDRERVRTTMRQLDREIRGAGREVRSLGDYALGCGYLALGDLESAKACLEATWREGNQSSGVASALGWTYGRLYQRSRTDLVERKDPGHRTKDLEALAQGLREPALALFRSQATIRPEERALMEGFLALSEDRYENGLTAARRVQELAPSRYEGYSLEATLHQIHAMALVHHGQISEGLALLERASKAFDLALEIGRSEPELHLQAAQCCFDIEFTLGQKRGARLEDFDKPIQAVDRALSMDPDNARALVLKSVLLLQRSTTLFYNAKPARPSLDEAIALARRAVSQAPERSYSYDQLAQSLEFKVLFAGDMDEVVRETCSEALRAVERSLSLAEASPRSHFLRGILRANKAENEMRHRGVDPHSDVALAETDFLRVIELGASRIPVMQGRIQALRTIARYEMDHDLDIRSTTTKLDKLFEEGIATWPDALQIRKDQAQWRAMLAEDLARHGKPFDELVQVGLAEARSALRLDPQDGVLEITVMRFHTLIGRALMARGHDPSADIRLALQSALRSRRLNRREPELWLALSRIHLLRARWEMTLRHSPAIPLREARQALTEGQLINPRNWEFPRTESEAFEFEADWERSMGMSSTRSMLQARERMRHAAALSPFRLDLHREIKRLDDKPI